MIYIKSMLARLLKDLNNVKSSTPLDIPTSYPSFNVITKDCLATKVKRKKLGVVMQFWQGLS